MDEVHIRSDASYKGGLVIGSIDNPDDPYTTVFSMMVSSLSTKFFSIVRLILLGSSSAETLYPLLNILFVILKLVVCYNDVGSQYTLIDLVDRGSLKYPSRCVVKCVKIVYETFLQIDKCESLCKEFYPGPSRSLLACISLSITEDRYSYIWKDRCFCGVWNWDILRKLRITWSNIILSKRVRNYNAMVLKKDNTK